MKETIECPNCGAKLTATKLFDVKCAYCGGTFRNPLSMSHLLVKRMIPFTFTENEIWHDLTEKLYNDSDTPKDIFYYLRYESYVQCYLPMYVCEGRYYTDWACTIEEHSHTDKNGNKYYNYRPVNGSTSGYFKKLILANYGENLPSFVKQHVDVIDLTSSLNSSIVYYDPSFLINERGETIACYEQDISIQEAGNKNEFKKSVSSDAYQAAQYMAPPSKYELRCNTNYDASINELIFLPIGFGRFSYKDKPYQFVINCAKSNIDYECPDTSTDVANTIGRSTGTIVGRIFLVIGILIIAALVVSIILVGEHNLSFEYVLAFLYIALFPTVFIIVRLGVEGGKRRNLLKAFKLAGKSQFCNAQAPDVAYADSRYNRFKRNNKILLWLYIAIIVAIGWGWCSLKQNSAHVEDERVEQARQDSITAAEKAGIEAERAEQARIEVERPEAYMNLFGNIGDSYNVSFEMNGTTGWYNYTRNGEECPTRSLELESYDKSSGRCVIKAYYNGQYIGKFSGTFREMGGGNPYGQSYNGNFISKDGLSIPFSLF